MKQPTDDYCVVTSLPSTNTQAFQASGVWGEAGRFFYMASLHLFHRELFFLFLKKTEEKIKEFCFEHQNPPQGTFSSTSVHYLSSLEKLLSQTPHVTGR